MKIAIMKSAHADLENLFEYYRNQGNLKTAEMFIKSIYQKMERLSEYPDSGRMVPEFQVEYLREIIFPPIRIIYRREPHHVSIIRVWRSERQLKID
jgi:toxin ParE1/3/4